MSAEKAKRTILHVDMDAFYASVEERERPELRGKPVIVGGDPSGRGVVAAANYTARSFGVRSAMPAAQAKRLCPDAVFVRQRMKLYAQVSEQLRAILERFSPQIEPLALDEAFVDVSTSARLHGDGPSIAAAIKLSVRSELGLVASIGVAPNKFLAKLASDLHKPDGLVVVEPDAVLEFLAPLPVARLWGAGRVVQQKLARHGIQTIGALRRCSEAQLRARLGTMGTRLWELAHGIDERPVVVDSKARSIGHETTFAADISDRVLLYGRLEALTEQVSRRLRAKKLTTKRVEIKVRYSGFDTVTRSRSLSSASASTKTLWSIVSDLFGLQLQRRADPVRLLGVAATDLVKSAMAQVDLFDEQQTERDQQLDQLADRLTARFGSEAARRGRSLPPR